MTLSIRVDDDIKLAPCLERQAGELFSIVDADRENLRSWLPWVDRTKQIEDTREFIRKSLEEYEQGVTVPLGIWYQDQLVGHISLMKIVAKHQAEIGYWISSDSEGKGIVTKSTKALVDYGFSHLKLKRIEIRCRVDNARSRAIPERLGFTFEGVSRLGESHNDRYYDLAVYSMLADEWQEDL